MRRQAFSLTELLIALGIIAVTAAIVVPRFLAVQASAQETTEAENVRTINRTFAVWEAAGGYAGANAKTSEVLRAIGADAGTVFTFDAATPEESVRDSSSGPTPSSGVRVALPSEIDTLLDQQTTPFAVVPYGDSLVYFNGTQRAFVALGGSSLQSVGRAGNLYLTIRESLQAIGGLQKDPYVVVSGGKVQGNNPLGLPTKKTTPKQICLDQGDGIYKFSSVQVGYSGGRAIVTSQMDFSPF
jgi:prepilin-type N-terminal cleavage/methylation domain-containing protein